MEARGLDWSGSWERQVTESCECCDELSVSTKEFLD